MKKWYFPLDNHENVLPDELGSFAYERRHHIHEGIDLYANQGDSVFACEDGEIVLVEWFTGEKSVDNSHWWNNTQALMVLGESGVIVYGEILTDLKVGDHVSRGSKLGTIETVLTKDKGRPMSMLHLELHKHESRSTFEWLPGCTKNEMLLDPTEQIEYAYRDRFDSTCWSNARYVVDDNICAEVLYEKES